MDLIGGLPRALHALRLSASADYYNYPRHAADVIDFLGELKSPPILVGHSFGGFIAQLIMTWDKEKVSSEAGIAAVGSVVRVPGCIG